MHQVRQQVDTRGRGPRRVAGTALFVAVALALTGCQGELKNGYLPAPISEEGERVRDLWVGAWAALLVVGVIVWGLILWCVVRYRKRKDDDGTLPVQLRYNVPIELLCTVIPIFMVATFFYFTARDESILLDNTKKPDVTVNVVGKQWAWDFNYTDANVYETGTHVDLTSGKEGAREKMATLYIPVNKRTQFVLNSRDVIHSFWVPQFLQKMDMIPGRTTKFQVFPTQTGTFQGKCAELCGAYHSEMLFMIKVVPQEEFDKEMQRLKSIGQTGQIPVSSSREKLMPGQDSNTTSDHGSVQ